MRAGLDGWRMHACVRPQREPAQRGGTRRARRQAPALVLGAAARRRGVGRLAARRRRAVAQPLRDLFLFGCFVNKYTGTEHRITPFAQLDDGELAPP